LKHPSLLPYEDQSFDAVISTGVLEHAANDGESLKELYRVIKPGGFLIVNKLPNRYSWTEWLNRHLQRPNHLRRYSLHEIKNTFLHYGFLPVASGYHQIFASLCNAQGPLKAKFVGRLGDALAPYNAIGERIWPFRCFATNVYIIGMKVGGIGNGDFGIRKRLKKRGIY